MPSEKAIINAFFIAVVTFAVMPVEWYLVAGMIVAIISQRKEMDRNNGISLGSEYGALMTMLIWPFVVAIGWS